jgi:hypothetical protein
LRLFGKHRGEHRTRLLKTAMPGDTTINVETNLGWLPGDVLALTSTTMIWYEKDMVRVKTYDSATGIVTLEKPLEYYHWGAATSTGD